MIDVPTRAGEDTQPPPAITEQHLAEYNQICESYRAGLKSILDITRYYMLWHAGLAAAVSYVISSPKLTDFVISICEKKIKILVVFISVLGLLSGFGALGISRRYEELHGSITPRALQLESLYDMRFLTDFEKIRKNPRFLGGQHIALVLFLLLAVLWLMFLVYSFIPDHDYIAQ